jgi:putative tryptophan/tyrosine transport system substrate-binding protein
MPPKVPLVGFLSIGGGDSPTGAAKLGGLLDGLVEQGLVEGRDLVIEYRYAEGMPERLPELAAQLVSLGVRVIVTGGPSMTDAARQVTDRIPIVMMGGPDPVVAGWAVSLARPGGNITGTTNAAEQLSARGTQILATLAPATRRLAAFNNLSLAGEEPLRDAVAGAAKLLGLQFLSLDLRVGTDIDPAFERARAWGMDAAFISALPPMNAQYQKVLAHVAQSQVPAISNQRFWVDDGLLMMIMSSQREHGLRGAEYVARILRGADPAEMPISRATQFELLVNTTTLAKLGLIMPTEVEIQVTEWVA